MPDGQRAALKAAETQAESNLLRDRVTAAVGDRYLIGQEVGRGGMAVVYAAQDVRLQRPVALKVLPPELAFRGDVRERFVREAQTAARLNHPHIVPIYAVHEEGGLVCFAMALVHGESLAARIVREPQTSFAYIAQMLAQVADALAYAHACDVVHRDVKPDNVLIDNDSGRAMVTDFGIARAADSGSRLTQTGIAVGTPAFMSPEQATGDREIDGRSDIYSLGVVGYLMLAGRLPFQANTTPAMLLKHVSETPTPLRAVRPDAPLALVEILERCLAKRPQDRWDNALQLRDALRTVQRDGAMQAGVHQAPPPLPSPAAAPVSYSALLRERALHPRTLEPADDPRRKPARIADASQAFVRHAKWVMGSATVSLGSLVIGDALDLRPMIIPMVSAGLAALAGAQMLAGDFMRLRRLGVSAGDAWNGSWQAIAALSDDRPYDVKMRELLALVGGDQLLASAYGELLCNAVDDRLTIKDVTAKLTDADKSLVPDVEPTADALLERISALASGLERLQRDLPTDALTHLESRVVAVQAEPEQAPDRERRRTLLTRQLSSLQELVARRETMQRQLDSASMALRSLRLDIVRLRTMGVGAAIHEVTNATQEARALSRDLEHVLSAVDEVRRL